MTRAPRAAATWSGARPRASLAFTSHSPVSSSQSARACGEPRRQACRQVPEAPRPARPARRRAPSARSHAPRCVVTSTTPASPRRPTENAPGGACGGGVTSIAQPASTRTTARLLPSSASTTSVVAPRRRKRRARASTSRAPVSRLTRPLPFRSHWTLPARATSSCATASAALRACSAFIADAVSPRGSGLRPSHTHGRALLRLRFRLKGHNPSPRQRVRRAEVEQKRVFEGYHIRIYRAAGKRRGGLGGPDSLSRALPSQY